MLQPRDMVVVFKGFEDSGAVIGHYGTVVRVGSSAFVAPDDRVVRVLVCGEEVDVRESDLFAVGRVDRSNPWVDSSGVVQFESTVDVNELRGSYQSRAGSFDFLFRVSKRPYPTYNLRIPAATERARRGHLEYNAGADATLDHAFVLQAIGEITGEFASPE